MDYIDERLDRVEAFEVVVVDEVDQPMRVVVLLLAELVAAEVEQHAQLPELLAVLEEPHDVVEGLVVVLLLERVDHLGVVAHEHHVARLLLGELAMGHDDHDDHSLP